jgi:hypothetical protein
MMMWEDLRRRREAVACNRLEDFDFRARVFQTGDWIEEARDALSCTVHLGMDRGTRPLRFRVVFEPASSRVRDIEIAERLPVS